MFVPYATDAPVYHFPWATIGMIVTNVVVFVITASLPADAGSESFDLGSSLESLALQSDRIAPWQWLTTNFLHADLMHLLGNMLFLWSFGLIVEGKIGWQRFIALYLFIGITYGALIQFGMFCLSDEYQMVLGASAVIFGLMAIAVIWAPRNEISVFVWFVIPRTFEVPIMYVGFFYFGLQLLHLSITRFQLSSELLHFVGLLVGAPLGIMMVKKGWVDCEGWDLFSVLAGDEGTESPSRDEVLRDGIQAEQERQARERTLVATSLRQALAGGNHAVGLAIFQKHTRTFSVEHPWPCELLRELTKQLQAAKQWQESAPVMSRLLAESPEQLPAVRLKLAQVLLQACNQPRRCLKVLAELPTSLADDQAKLADRLQMAAERAIDQGGEDFELDETTS